MSNDFDKNEDLESQDIKVQSFLRLFSAYQHRIYGYIMSLVRDWNQSDDIFQETTGVLWIKFNQFVPETDFLSWALKIAYYQVLSHQKKVNVHRKYFSQQTLEKLNEVAISSSNDSEASLNALRKCIELLPDRSKELISLRYEDGATVLKIAQRVQQSVNTLYKDYQKIHTQLFQCIRKQMVWK